jgi:hypothetical protein
MESFGNYVQYGCGMSCPDLWINFDASPRLWLQQLPIVGRAFQRGETVFPRRMPNLFRRNSSGLASLKFVDESSVILPASSLNWSRKDRVSLVAAL